MGPNFANYTAGYGSLYGNVPPPRPPSPFGLNPSAPGGPLEGLLQALLPLVSEQVRQQFGGFGFTFGSDMNVASASYARDFLGQLNNARQFGASRDRQQVEDLFRGLAVAVGQDPVGRNNRGLSTFAPDVERAIGRLSGDASQMLPVLAAIFPDAVDRLLPRGSLTVAAGSFVNAGRFVTDPLTGRPLAETPDFAARVLGPLLDRGPAATAGLGAGRLGQTYEELVRLGFIGSGDDLRGQVNARKATGGVFGIGMSGDDARDVQTQRIRDRIEAYSQTVAAINDIFAENGRANAPMAELIKSLQALTAGGLGVYDPATLATITRNLQGAGQLSGINLQGLTQLVGGTGLLLGQFGGNRGLAAPIALYAAAAGGVFADKGFGTPSPEAIGRDDFVAAVARDRAAFSGSDAGNLVGALSVLGRYAPEGSDLKNVADALNRGELGADGFDLRSAQRSDIVSILARSGFTKDPEGVLLRQLQATRNNRAALVENQGLMRAGDQLQRNEFEFLILSVLGGGIDNLGGNPRALLDAIYAGSRGEDVRLDSDAAKKAARILGLGAEGEAEIGNLLGRVGEIRGTSGFTAARMFDPQTQNATDAWVRRFGARGKQMQDLQALGRGGFGRLLTSSITNFARTGKANWQDLILGTLGFVPQSEADAAMGIGVPLLDWFGQASTPGTLLNFLTTSEDGALGTLGGALQRFNADGSPRGAPKKGWGEMGAEVQEEATIFGAPLSRFRGKGGPVGAANTNVSIQVAKVVFADGGMTITGDGSAKVGS